MGMSKEGMTVGELIEHLKELPQQFKVKISVHYDDCEHIQDLRGVYSLMSSDIDWILLRGKK